MAEKMTLVAGPVEKLEQLCQRDGCWKPSLVRFGIYQLGPSGVSRVATSIRCVDCNGAVVLRERR